MNTERESISRRAVVTGGCSGIGSAIAAALRADGSDVIVVDIGDEADVYLDVSVAQDVDNAASAIGAVDVLINCAGIPGPSKPVVEVTDEEWAFTMAVNLTGAFNLCRAFVPAMVERGWGRVVNVASIAGKEGNPNLAPYSVSKAGMIALTKSLGKELAQTGVLVNAVAPAVIATGMNANTAHDVMDYMISRIPMGRLGQPEEVAELVRWLASDRCTFSTGAVFDASGGRATY